MQKCPAFPDKIQHETREEALEHLKKLVFRNASTGQSAESRGLHVYACDACGSWHVGHAPKTLVWHYAPATLLDTVLETDRLPVPPPMAYYPLNPEARRTGSDTRNLSVRLSRSFLERYRRRMPEKVRVYFPWLGEELTLPKHHIVRHPVLWFSRNQRWDYVMSTTPAMLIKRSALEVGGQGLVRFGISPSLAPLRWGDYQKLNPMSEDATMMMEFSGEPGDWLAADADIPLEKIERIEVYFNGEWVAVDDVDPEAFEAYVAGREAAYKAAYESMSAKQSLATGDKRAPQEYMDLMTVRPHRTIRKLFDWQFEVLNLEGDERIVFEDFAILHIREGSDEQTDTASDPVARD